MRNVDENTITQIVLARHAEGANPRLNQIMTSLVQHLHAFAREVRLTEEEWFKGIEFLTAAGHITDDKRQEFILLSDTLGLSMLVTAMNNRKPEGCTESTVLGPFFVADAPGYQNGDDVANGAKGEPCLVTGRVKGLDGEPVANAIIDVWQADSDGFYDVQYEGNADALGRGRLRSRADGSFNFRSVTAESYPIPYDGPVGKMLEALGRHPWRPAHLHFMIEAPGYERLITHVFRSGDRYLDSDAVFGVRSSLIADWQQHDAGIAPDGTKIDVPYSTLDFTFVLNPAHESAV
ncbi:intradiol ring-cleavage dioxygenase [Paraburkholderia rhynchosiae]|uniref:Hydroxyquinol 1,2-dioxygenase n=1 Tax=Paraburkholderia rhynchosiae TaxID=487049 RepID=A0A2N7WIP8_9BURK|nr:intradiol ring-cleavage dioxygenase [Paraburkholderia rhynchosiae]PMS29272.1 hydroxyquinol 1,2-dioxygenase [Paraburkholderia rhynchosiae]CAB3708752.1 Hydroxyquinol 1,2-dioxygenase [Paraburkholderia rhynchosiae]